MSAILEILFEFAMEGVAWLLAKGSLYLESLLK